MLQRESLQSRSPEPSSPYHLRLNGTEKARSRVTCKSSTPVSTPTSAPTTSTTTATLMAALQEQQQAAQPITFDMNSMSALMNAILGGGQQAGGRGGGIIYGYGRKKRATDSLMQASLNLGFQVTLKLNKDDKIDVSLVNQGTLFDDNSHLTHLTSWLPFG